MKYLIIILSLFVSLQCFGASRFWIGGGTTTQWDASPTTNWAATSGGTTRVAAPTSSDDVTFDGVGTNANTVCVITTNNPTFLSLTFSSGYTSTITINTGRTLTVAGNFTDNTAHTWTVSGTGSMTISAASTITSGGKTFPGPVTFSGANTKTLSGSWTISGTLTLSGTTTLNWTTNETLSCAGLTTNSACSGTAKVIITGGTWSGAVAIQNNLDIQGTITIGSNITYNTGTLTYVSGSITTTSSTLTIGASTTLNTNGITWNNIIIGATSTLTLNSLLSATGTFTINSGVDVTFAGTSGFTLGTFTSSAGNARTITLKNGVTYTITTALNAFLTPHNTTLTFTSDDGTLTAALTLNQGATCNVLANFTRINASGGRTIRSFNGTLTSCTNIVAFNDIGTSKH